MPPEPTDAADGPVAPPKAAATADAPRLGKRSFLLFVGLGVAALLALGPKLPRDQRLRVKLPGHAAVREARIAWFSTDGEPLREATFTYAPGGAPEALIHELRLPDGDQRRRYRAEGIYTNAQLKPRLVKRYCVLDQPAQELLEQAMARLRLSPRAHGRILRVARTIADLADSERIETVHIAEAIQYRSFDRNPDV